MDSPAALTSAGPLPNSRSRRACTQMATPSPPSAHASTSTLRQSETGSDDPVYESEPAEDEGDGPIRIERLQRSLGAASRATRSLAEIAATFDIAPSTLTRELRLAGIPIRRRGRRSTT